MNGKGLGCRWSWKLLSPMVLLGAGALLTALEILTPCVVSAQGGGDVLMEENTHPDRVSGVSIPAAIKRGFYLTSAGYYPSQALTACTKGYHMASMWELLDVSSLNYHYKHPYALVLGDSGYGPPTFVPGWIRTGLFASVGTGVGVGNCNAWTSNDVNYYGTMVNLKYDWTTPSTGLGPWEARSSTCQGTASVWCISNTK